MRNYFLEVLKKVVILAIVVILFVLLEKVWPQAAATVTIISIFYFAVFKP